MAGDRGNTWAPARKLRCEKNVGCFGLAKGCRGCVVRHGGCRGRKLVPFGITFLEASELSDITLIFDPHCGHVFEEFKVGAS